MADDDDDEYNYEYFEGESPTKQIQNKDTEEDEQHSQKVNSQVETLTERLQKCEKELEEEREEHNRTKKLMEELRKESSEIIELKARVHELEFELKDSTVNSKPSNKLYEAFSDFCTLHDLDHIKISKNNFTDDKCLLVLKEATKAIDASIKRTTDTPASKKNAKGDEDLSQRVADLEEELRLALGAAEDIRALKAKAIHLVERIRSEKEEKLRAQQEVKSFTKKLTMLSVHIEKLMIHLKHEAASKIKALDQLRESERRNQNLQTRLSVTLKKTAAKDTFIAELREGSKILEDQLRLMDEKYLELRTKLDYAREVARTKVSKAQRQASELRVKFALAGNKTPLDSIMLPNGIGEEALSKSVSLPVVRRSSPNSKNSPKRKQHQHQHTHNSLDRSSSKLYASKSTNEYSNSDQGGLAVDNVLEKIRRLKGQKTEWTEEKMRALVNTR